MFYAGSGLGKRFTLSHGVMSSAFPSKRDFSVLEVTETLQDGLLEGPLPSPQILQMHLFLGHCSEALPSEHEKHMQGPGKTLKSIR